MTGVGIFPEMHLGGPDVRGVGLCFGCEVSEIDQLPIDPDCGEPGPITLGIRALQAAVSLPSLAVGSVTLRGAGTQVGDSVVVADAVCMVDPTDWHLSINQKPRQPMGKVGTTVDSHADVAAKIWCPGYRPFSFDISSSPTIDSPTEYAGGWVIIQKLLNFPSKDRDKLGIYIHFHVNCLPQVSGERNG